MYTQQQAYKNSETIIDNNFIISIDLSHTVEYIFNKKKLCFQNHVFKMVCQVSRTQPIFIIVFVYF